jgi:predicted Ser/Thr protein kinase
MALTAGTRLGPYEIIAPIGAGGMGEVYRARDTKLGRDVAIKVLPALLAQDPERLARFEREAKVLASLNHPNIAQIYGIEDRALIMELVEGQTLQGPLPLETALDYARQIADALEAAHEKGITHRDLKPANIMITPAGVVKVLDFGLAAVAQSSDPSNPANSPTLTISPTRAGMILGTAAYMSPEQARGKAVDRRADIWAFGVVLFEILTGKPLFAGETVSDTLAHVLIREPDWEQVPAKVRRLLEACLQKDPKQRLQAIGDWRLLLADAQPQSTAPTQSRLGRVAWVVAGVLLVALASLAFVHFREKPPVKELVRFEIPAPANASLNLDLAVSPDGRKTAFIVTGADRKSMIWIRSLDTEEARPLAGTEDASGAPVWSPDSRYLAFASGGKLKRIEASGGPAQTICDALTVTGGFGPRTTGFSLEAWDPCKWSRPPAGCPRRSLRSTTPAMNLHTGIRRCCRTGIISSTGEYRYLTKMAVSTLVPWTRSRSSRAPRNYCPTLPTQCTCHRLWRAVHRALCCSCAGSSIRLLVQGAARYWRNRSIRSGWNLPVTRFPSPSRSDLLARLPPVLSPSGALEPN